MRRYLKLLIGTMFISATPVAAETARDPQIVAAFDALQKLDNRMLEIGYRLTTANAKFCADTVQRAGLQLHDIAQYRSPAEARAAFSFPSDIAVSALANNGAAARSGMKLNDGILKINGTDIDDIIAAAKSQKNRKNYARMEQVEQHWQNALKSEQVNLQIKRGAEILDILVEPTPACPSQFQLDTSSRRDAGADGKLVRVTVGLVEYVANDDELAAIVAHELAHNLLKHRDRLNAAKISRGLFKGLGRNARIIKASELEADRLSLWLMINAGYDPNAAITFWSRYGKQHGKGIFSSATHYRWKKRVGFMNEELEKIEATLPKDGLREPPLLAKAFADLAAK